MIKLDITCIVITILLSLLVIACGEQETVEEPKTDLSISISNSFLSIFLGFNSYFLNDPNSSDYF